MMKASDAVGLFVLAFLFGLAWLGMVFFFDFMPTFGIPPTDLKGVLATLGIGMGAGALALLGLYFLLGEARMEALLAEVFETIASMLFLR